MPSESIQTKVWIPSQSLTTFFHTHKGKAITAIALLLIAGGGAWLHLKDTPLLAYSLMGVGGAVLALRLVKHVCSKPYTYRVASYHSPTEETKGKLTEPLKAAFKQMGSLDFICLQSTNGLHCDEMRSLLPEGFQSYTRSGWEGMIAWDSSRFGLMKVSSFPSDLAVLKDYSNGATVCIGNAHLPPPCTSQRIERHGEADEAQLYEILKAMDVADADLTIYGGNFNASKECNDFRFKILEKKGYVRNMSDIDATEKLMDGSWRKSDYIFAKARLPKGAYMATNQIDWTRKPLCELPGSSHLPMAEQVLVSSF